jgi:hypothetical protein
MRTFNKRQQSKHRHAKPDVTQWHAKTCFMRSSDATPFREKRYRG